MPPKRFSRKRGAFRTSASTTQRSIHASGNEIMADAGFYWAALTASGSASSPGPIGNLYGPNFNPQAISGNGGVAISLSPWVMGPRCRDLANCGYAMYRFRRLRIDFNPAQIAFQQTGAVGLGGTSAGVIYTSASGTKAAVSNPATGRDVQTTWELAVGFSRDPTTGPLNFNEVVQSGGKVVNALRRFSVPIRFRCPWLYTGFSADFVGLTTAEVRQMFFGQFNAVWKNPPASNLNTVGASASTFVFGDFQVHWDVEFKFPIDTSADDFDRLLFHKTLLQTLQGSETKKSHGPPTPSSPFEEVKSSEEPDDVGSVLERNLQAVFSSNSVPSSVRPIQKSTHLSLTPSTHKQK